MKKKLVSSSKIVRGKQEINGIQLLEDNIQNFRKINKNMLVRNNDSWTAIRQTTPNLMVTQISNNLSKISVSSNRSHQFEKSDIKYLPQGKMSAQLNICKSIEKFKEKNNDYKIKKRSCAQSRTIKNKQRSVHSDLYHLLRQLKAVCSGIRQIYDNIKGIFQVLQTKWNSEMKIINEKFLKQSMKTVDKIQNTFNIFQKKLIDTNSVFSENNHAKNRKFGRRFTISLENEKNEMMFNCQQKMNQSQDLYQKKPIYTKLNDIPRVLDEQSKEVSQISTSSKKSKKDIQIKLKSQLGVISETIRRMKSLAQIK